MYEAISSNAFWNLMTSSYTSIFNLALEVSEYCQYLNENLDLTLSLDVYVNTFSSFLHVTPNTFSPSSSLDTSSVPSVLSPLSASLTSTEFEIHLIKLKFPFSRMAFTHLRRMSQSYLSSDPCRSFLTDGSECSLLTALIVCSM